MDDIEIRTSTGLHKLSLEKTLKILGHTTMPHERKTAWMTGCRVRTKAWSQKTLESRDGETKAIRRLFRFNKKRG